MPRYRVTMETPVLLDDIRRQQGKERMRDIFYSLCLQNPDDALLMLNDSALRYPSLYILQPEILKLHLDELLNDRNRRALEISRGLLARKQSGAYESRQEDHAILRWMLQTGYDEGNLGDQYDEIMDFTAILLVKEHHDNACLAPLADMIFYRHRLGTFTYDAEWALFECRDPECLVMVANRLLSSDPQDVVLARRLLGFIPCFGDATADPQQQYRCVMWWIETNRPYLRYTGESGLKGSNPSRFAIALDYKYLQQPVASNVESMLSTQEQSKLQSFRGLNSEMQQLLSECSCWLRAYSWGQWERWMSMSLPDQIDTARELAAGGVLS